MSDSLPSQDRDRLRDLAPDLRELALRAQAHLARGEYAQATAPLDRAMARAPSHPELLRLCGLHEHFHGRSVGAIALLRKAAAARPDDALTASNLGAALAQLGDVGAALREFRRATELDPTLADAWLNLGRALDLGHDAAGAYAAFGAVLELDPSHRPARILRAEAAKTLGRIAEAETLLRGVLREDPSSVAAWIALVNLKAFRGAGDLDGLRRLYDDASLSPTQRIDVGFAYAGMLEAAGDYPRAFAVFAEANAAKRATLDWNAGAVDALVDDILAAFPSVPRPASERGHGVVFLVGMPRSGSTLAEQIVGSHPAAAALGESGFVAEILQAEARRRGVRFPLWVADASDDDWVRLGDAYLARIAPMRGSAEVVTDKTLTNWQTLGAIRRMLPAARVVHCLRDPLETAWSCFKHNFASDQLWSYDFAELAAFFADSLRAMAAWNARFPDWIRVHRHEALLAEPEARTRALLDACGLAFDPRCLRFHESVGEVRTASAAQVRVPLRADASIAARYGALLDPLRHALDARLRRLAVAQA